MGESWADQIMETYGECGDRIDEYLQESGQHLLIEERLHQIGSMGYVQRGNRPRFVFVPLLDEDF